MALSLSLSLPPFYSKFTIRILRTNECHVFAQMVILKNDNDPAGSRLSCNFSLARDVLVLSMTRFKRFRRIFVSREEIL